MSQTPQAPEVTGSMFLFQKPALLTRDLHGELGLHRAVKPFSFCANVRAVPLTVSEIPSAGKHYPIVFSAQTDIVPLAVVGLFEDINLYVNEAGEWEPDAYIPGYIRRYPFAFATETGGDRLALVIDTAYSGVAPGGEYPLFEDGQPSVTTQNAIDFCRNYEQDRQLTNNVLKKVETMNLVAGQSAQFTPPGSEGAQPEVFAQYFGIDEQALNNLPDEKFIELRRAGLLPVIYSQLLSMGNWRHILGRRARRHNLQGDAVMKPLTSN